MKKTKQKLDNSVEVTVLRLLAQREHTKHELCQKLRQRGYDIDAVLPVLERLEAQGWQSDTRFIESYISARIRKGYGPLKIAQELQQRGLPSKLVDQHLSLYAVDWVAQLKQTYFKKFKNIPPTDFKEKAKQIRFLQSRGFDLAEIQSVFDFSE